MTPTANWRASLSAGCLAFATPWALAAADLQGAADPPGLARFPGTWIVAYRSETPVRRYAFVTGRVDRSHRDLRVDRGERVSARLSRVTYRAPDGTRLEDVVAHYVQAVDALSMPVEFTCRGRDCGRSTVWANDVFGVKELVAPDPAQFYLAASDGRVLLAIYAVQRGNRRVYAHVDRALRDAPEQDAAAALVAALRRDGFVVLPDIAPNATGGIEADALAKLGDIAAQVADAFGEIHVVCHMDGPAAPAERTSQRCAEQAVVPFATAGIEASAHGAGALLPRNGKPRRRVELVLPNATGT